MPATGSPLSPPRGTLTDLEPNEPMSWRHAIMRFCVAGLVASGLALAIAATCAAQGADDLGDAPGSSSGALSRGGTSSAGHQSVEEEFGLDPNPSKGWPGRVRLSLEDCLRLALTRNMRLRAAGEDIEAARSQRQEASAAFWPIIEYKYRMAPVPTDVDNAFNAFFDGQLTFFNSIHVGIGMPVTTFGQLLLAKRLADGGIEAAKIRRAQTESEVVYQVKQLFYGIQLAHETIGLLEDALKKIDKRIGAEKRKQAWGEDEDWNNGDKVDAEQGKVGAEVEAEALEDVDEDLPGIDPYDMAQLKAFKLELEKRLDEARHNEELAYEGLAIQLDLEPGTSIALDRLSLSPDPARLDRVEEFVDASISGQHEANLLDIGVETRHKQYKLEKRKVLPSAGMGFFVDVGRTTGEIRGLQLTDDFNDPFNYTRAGFGFELKGTLDFHGSYARIKKAKAEYHKASYERMIARRAISADARKAYLEAKRAQENLRRARRAESLAKQMMFLSKVNADIGIGDNERYTDALKAVLLSRGIYYKSVFDYNVALASLERRIGPHRYREVVPSAPVVFDDFQNGEGGEGFMTIDSYYGGKGEGDTYGRQTEDNGTTMGDVDE